MGALLDYIAVAQDQDDVGVADGREAVRDDEARAVGHEGVHGALDELLGAGVDVGGCLVQDQGRSVSQNGAGNGDELPLALAEVGALLVDHKVIAAGQGVDKVVASSGSGGGLYLGIGGVWAAIADVLANRAVEEPGVLQDHGKLLAKLGAVPVAHVHAVDAQAARVHVVETLQQLDDGRLAGAGGANDGHGLTGLGRAAKVVDDGLLGCVAKAHVVELHAALAHGRDLRVCGVLLLGCGQELKDALGGRGHRLHGVAHVGQLLDGLGEVAHVLDEALDVAGGRVAGKRQARAHHHDGHVAGVAHQAHERHHEAREKLRAPTRGEQLVVLLVKGGDGVVCAVEDLDDVLAGKVLFDKAVDLAQNVLLRAEVRLREVHHGAHDHGGHGQGDHHDARERQADREHHDQHAHDLRDAGDQLGYRLVERLAQGIDVVGDAREDVAFAVGVEVAHGDARDLLGDLFAHAVAHFLGDSGHEPALRQVAGRACQVQAQKQGQRAGDPVEVDGSGARDLGNQPLVELGRDLAQDLGANDVEDHRAYGKDQREDDRHLVLAHVGKQLEHGVLEVFGFLTGGAKAAAAAHGASARAVVGALGDLGLAHLVCH